MVLELEEEVLVEAEVERCGGMSRNELFFVFSPSLVPVGNLNWDIKLLLVLVKPSGLKDWNLLSWKHSPGWKTGTKGSFQSGQHALSAVVNLPEML